MSKIEQAKNSADIVDVVGRVVKLSKKGAIYSGLCPFHDEKTPSFTVSPAKQKYNCYGCGAHGDVVDFVASNRNISLGDAADFLGGNLSGLTYKPPPDPAVFKPDFEIITPMPYPDEAAMIHHELGKPSKVYEYRGKQNELLQLVLRFEQGEGRKEFRPLSYIEKDGNRRHSFKAIPSPRPLYGLPELFSRPKASVMVVEGEKTADAAKILFPSVVVVTWHGGSSSVRLYDWDVLKGRRVILCPDADYTKRDRDRNVRPWENQPGNKAMLDVATILEGVAKVIKWNPPPKDVPCGWDWADTDWDSVQALDYVRGNMFEPAEVFAQNSGTVWSDGESSAVPETFEALLGIGAGDGAGDGSGAGDQPEHQPTSALAQIQPDKRNQIQLPFQPLGYSVENGTQHYWVFSYLNEVILRYTTSGIANENVLKEIAPADYWEAYYAKKGGIHIGNAAEMVRQSCRQVGTFSPDRIRGRGAWVDKGKMVVHVGEHLIVNGSKISITDYDTAFAYQKKPYLMRGLVEPLDNKAANVLVQACERFEWERKASAILLAGWIVIAPFAGALKWRPHVWLTGAAGTGKSWVLKNVVRRCLGRFQLALQSKTTEPAVRQALESDAIPVVFDEFEAENEQERARIQAIIDLMRSASSDDGGMIAKGSAGGKSVFYAVRSAFAVASIAQTLEMHSDVSRITTLGMKKSEDTAKRANAKFIDEELTDEWVQGLHSRTIGLLPTIMENIKVFSEAVATELGDTRIGDQLGTMLAGAYSLYSRGVIEYDAALAFVRRHDWAEERSKDESKDEYRLLNALLEHLNKFDAGRMQVERSIGELVYIAAGISDDPVVTVEKAESRLAQIGMGFKDGYFSVSSTSGYVRNTALRNTPWAKSYFKVLARLDGAIITEPTRLTAGVPQRSLAIPVTEIYEGYQMPGGVDSPENADESFWENPPPF